MTDNLYCQDIPVGKWRTHFSYRNAKHVVKTNDKLFCASPFGFFSYDLASSVTRKLSKLDGLSDIGVSTMRFNLEDNVLVLGYESGFLDFIYQDRISSVNEIVESPLDKVKNIYDLTFFEDFTYVASGVGVVVIETESTDLLENYIQIGPSGMEVEVFEVEVFQDLLFIVTPEGIQSGDLSLNLLDFNNWKRYSGTEGFVQLAQSNEALYTVSKDSVYQYVTGDQWINTLVSLPNGASKIFSIDDGIYSATRDSIYVFNQERFESILSVGLTFVNDFTSVDDRYFFADDSLGLVDQDGVLLIPDGPYSDDFSRVKVVDNNVFAFHAPDPSFHDPNEKVEPFSKFDGLWDIEILEGFANVSDVEVLDDRRFFSSIGGGFFDESQNQIKKNLGGGQTDSDTIITALTSDGMKIWATSFNSNTPLISYDLLGETESYTSSYFGENQFETIDASIFGTLWIKVSDGNIIAFEPQIEAFERITSIDGLPGDVTDISLSVGDDAWVTTDNGPATFFSASSIVDNADAILPSFDNRFLFEDENLNAVVTDGGSRVWFGSDRGLWLFDENISEQLFRFTAENSPLPSDKITSLSYNGKNGEVFINTEKGLVSYRSASSLGTFEHTDVNIFPNPVRPEYDGLVGIEGLANNANLKVTDLNGNLVKELLASGGAAAWDLTGQSGEVVSGIYLIFSSSSDGNETFVGKVAVIR